jgi:hypothetical protein
MRGAANWTYRISFISFLAGIVITSFAAAIAYVEDPGRPGRSMPPAMQPVDMPWNQKYRGLSVEQLIRAMGEDDPAQVTDDLK